MKKIIFISFMFIVLNCDVSKTIKRTESNKERINDLEKDISKMNYDLEIFKEKLKILSTQETLKVKNKKKENFKSWNYITYIGKNKFRVWVNKEPDGITIIYGSIESFEDGEFFGHQMWIIDNKIVDNLIINKPRKAIVNIKFVK